MREASMNFTAKPDKDFFRRAAPRDKKLEKQFAVAWKTALDAGW